MSTIRTLLTCTLLAVAAAATPAAAQQSLTQTAGITDTDLANLIDSLGLEAERTESRFDFEFLAKMDSDQWKLSMSTVLSQDGKTVWLMAWLDELPKSAAEVPRTALLRLLAENDKMGNGKFFAYIAGSRRFVLQRIVSTEGMTSDSFKAALQDLGSTVVQTYPQWAVANWKPPTPVAEPIVRYAVQLADASRPGRASASEFVNRCVSWGAGLRAAQNLVLGAKAKALLDGRPHVSVGDIQSLALPVLRHRVLLSYRAEAEGVTVPSLVSHLLESVKSPTE